MGAIKKLKVVAENIVSHSISGLSGLVPHILGRCMDTGCKSYTIDLLDRVDAFGFGSKYEALVLATASVQRHFEGFLVKNGGDLQDISSAHLEFVILDELGEGWPRFSCESVILTTTGRKFSHKIDSGDWVDSNRDDPLEEVQKEIRDSWTKGPGGSEV